jgi:hypothetical protein
LTAGCVFWWAIHSDLRGTGVVFIFLGVAVTAHLRVYTEKLTRFCPRHAAKLAGIFQPVTAVLAVPAPNLSAFMF